MHCDCHMHMVLDGADWKAAIARHRQAVDEAWVRKILAHYQACNGTQHSGDNNPLAEAAKP